MLKPITWNADGAISNGIWIILGMSNDSYRGYSASTFEKGRSFVERAFNHTTEWREASLEDWRFQATSAYSDGSEPVVVKLDGEVFDLVDIEQCFVVAGIRSSEPSRYVTTPDGTSFNDSAHMEQMKGDKRHCISR